MIDVAAKSALGSTQRIVLRNVSTVGRAAGVVAHENTPAYLGRLEKLGLVEFGDEDETLAVQYDILSTDRLIKQASSSIDRQRRSSPRTR